MYKKLQKMFILIFCIIFFTFTFLKPVYAFSFFETSNNEVIQSNTWNYWNKLHNITHSLPNCFNNAPKELKICADNGEKILNAKINEVREIPLMNVDEDLLSFSSDLLEFYSQEFALYEKVKYYAEDLGNENIFVTLVTSFINGFLFGIPGAIASATEVNDTQNKYESRNSEINSQIDNRNNKVLEINRAEQKLRKILSQRYHKEFPVLNNLF